MAAPGPTLLFTSDSGSQFSPKLEGGVCSLEGMSDELDLSESAAYGANSDERRSSSSSAAGSTDNGTSIGADTPHRATRHHHQHRPQTLSPLSSVSHIYDDGDGEGPGATAATSAPSMRTRVRHSHIHALGLSDHSDGGVLAAETLTDVSPSPGPPPAPPEYDPLPQRSATVQPTASQIANASGINLRENALETPLIPVAVEFEDGLIPVEVVGSITSSESRPESTVGAAGQDGTTTTDQPPRGLGSGQASPASTIDPWPPMSPAAATDRRHSATTLALPGEDVVFEGDLKVGECKEEGSLYIWQNALSRDFRIQWHTSSGKETMWMRPSSAQLVPAYAESHSSPLRVYLRDTNGTQTPPFEFATPDELFKLQTSLTGERVVLDVSVAKWIRANKPKGDSSAETYTGIRVQIWHETKKYNLPRRLSGESRASTASGDTLSGPRRDWVVPQQSRLVVFLGEAGGLLTLPITDDVEMEDKGDVFVKLKARRYSGLRRRRSQSGVRARIVSPTDRVALPFRDTTIDNSERYESYKNIDIEFENQTTKKEFVSVWSEVVEFRRKQRARIEKIQEEMGRQTFTGKQAIRQWF